MCSHSKSHAMIKYCRQTLIASGIEALGMVGVNLQAGPYPPPPPAQPRALNASCTMAWEMCLAVPCGSLPVCQAADHTGPIV